MQDSTTKVLAGTGKALDDRFGGAGGLRKQMKKLFPDHWSFMLGEIALYSFVVLLLTGIFLTFFYQPSLEHTVYEGSYEKLRGIPMSEAYESTIYLSLEVRGGLLMRQIHHWAALLFVAAIMVHMFRVFFTGAFRKPREINWLIGITLFTLAMLEGFAGYTLPDDLLSGVGLRIFVSVVFLSIPVVGTYLMYFAFGGGFPEGLAGEFIPRLYVVHILLVPGILLALIGAHMLIMWHQKHTVWASKKQTNHNTVGVPFFPHFMAKTGAFFMFVFGALSLLSAFVQINPVWMYGPYNPVHVTAGAQPDWYIGILEGGLRIMPGAETVLFGEWTIIWSTLVPALIVPGVLFTLLAVYPFIEKWITKDNTEHHVLNRPRDVPVRTAIGAAWISVYLVLWIAGGNDIIADKFSLSVNTLTWIFRVMIFAAPVIVFMMTKRICIGLQRKDAHLLHEGVETGVIRRLPSGAYEEVTRTPSDEMLGKIESTEPAQPEALPELADGHGVEAKHALLQRLRLSAQRWYTQDNVARDGYGNGHGYGHGGADEVEQGDRKELSGRTE
ncbi:MAG: ubiquinol-cytochrome c reductase cytochrome b subunit [Streptosporangiales bacterium]|nr:ubiquinol-cytochrome c reductase cytochrome b subunit [Streptosporangiales bacterium]